MTRFKRLRLAIFLLVNTQILANVGPCLFSRFRAGQRWSRIARTALVEQDQVALGEKWSEDAVDIIIAIFQSTPAGTAFQINRSVGFRLRVVTFEIRYGDPDRAT